MNKKSNKKTKNYYNGIAKGYALLYHEEQKSKISKIISFLPSSGLVLDLGSGDGVLNQFLNLKNIQLISCDLSDELLKLNSNSNKIQASVLSLPFKDESFDSVISFTMLQDISNPILAINEIKRVLNKEGILILSFLNLSKKYEKIIKKIIYEFEILFEYKEIKDTILVLKKK